MLCLFYVLSLFDTNSRLYLFSLSCNVYLMSINHQQALLNFKLHIYIYIYIYIGNIVICVNLTLRCIHLYLSFSIAVFIIKLICNLLLFPVYLNFLLISFTVFAYLNFILILLVCFLCILLEYSLLTCPISSGFVPFGFTESKNKFSSIQFSSILHQLKKKTLL